MATVTAFNAERMLEIENTTVVGGLIDPAGHLLLTTREGDEIDAGEVKGEQGDPGVDGDATLPAGTISLWTGDVAPANWLICNGAAVSRIAYASLFAIIGTKYGVGDGATTFNLPNLSGRTPVGLDAAQTEFNALAKTGGAKTHTLTTAQMPSHSHGGVSGGGNSMFYRLVVGAGSSRNGNHAVGYNGPSGYADYTDANYPTSYHTHNIPAEGSGSAHNILQPFQVVNFIIKFSNGDTPGDSQLTDRVSDLEMATSPLPAGSISMWTADTAPTNWLLCDGAAVSRTVYASLYAVIGTKYGAGNGTTTFNVPNLKGRVPVGKDSAQTEFDNLGETGGAKTQSLSHTHTLSDAGGARIAIAARAADQILMRRITGSSYTPTHSIDLTGGGAAGYTTAETAVAGLGGLTDSESLTANLLQPYQVVNYIIKAVDGYTPGDSQLATRISVVEAAVDSNALALRDKMRRLQSVMTGGGTRKASAAGVSWSERIIFLGSGWEDPAPADGYWEVTMPPNGTVIPVYGSNSSTSSTVSSDTIQMNGWYALYYDIPLDGPKASDPSRFKLVGYSAMMPFTPPPTWVLIVARNSDITNHPVYYWGDGRTQDYWRVFTLGQSWVDFDTTPGYIGHQWKFAGDGAIKLRGLIKNGTFSTSVAAASWGATRAPEAREIFHCASNTGSARIDVLDTGDLLIYAAYNGGSNAWVSLAGITWYPGA